MLRVLPPVVLAILPLCWSLVLGFASSLFCNLGLGVLRIKELPLPADARGATCILLGVLLSMMMVFPPQPQPLFHEFQPQGLFQE